MERTDITEFYVVHEQTIDRLHVTELPWNFEKHLETLQTLETEDAFILITRAGREIADATKLKTLLESAPPLFDLAILGCNKYSKFVDNISTYLMRLKKHGKWRQSTFVEFEDITSYIVRKPMVKGTTYRDLRKFCHSDALYSSQLSTVAGKYLDDGSPMIICHLLQKYLGDEVGVLARPICQIWGFEMNFLHMCLCAFLLICGMFGIHKIYLLRFVCLCFAIEPLENMLFKVIFFITVSNILYTYGKNPLFFW